MILVCYASQDGQCLRIAQRVAARLMRAGHTVGLRALHQLDAQELAQAQACVLGAAVRYGRHLPALQAAVQQHLPHLQSRPTAFFSVNAVARKPEKCGPATNPYARKFLARTPWQPQHVAVFGGRIDYPALGFWEAQIIRWIMALTHGPTDTTQAWEFTDWAQVDAWGDALAAAYAHPQPPEAAD